MHGAGAILILFIQIGLILALSRAVGYVFARLRQPQVMGEIIAGIMLGPSLLGWVAPGIYRTVFPPESLGYLNLFSQMGVVLFVFLVGLELDPHLLRQRAHSTAAISLASIAVPFALGFATAAVLYQPLFHDPQRRHFLASALFMGTAMSITALPVLARLLTERNLHRTPVGMVSIASAAAKDVASWCILAFVVAVARDYSHPQEAVQTAALAVAYLAAMVLLVRPFLRQLERVHERWGHQNQNLLAIVFLLVLLSAVATEKIGIHALFGALVMGFAMPKGSHFVRYVSEKVEDFVVVLLLPVFFAYTGINTQIGLLNSAGLWLMAVLLIGVACVGTFGGTAVAGRLVGMPWREASALGVLMNTRGLMELVILNIGRELRVISGEVFAMMVIMAVVTTAVAAPLLHWILPSMFAAAAKAAGKVYSVLIPVSLPRSGETLCELAAALIQPPAKPGDSASRIYALHFRAPSEREGFDAGLVQSGQVDPVLRPLLEKAAERQLPIEPLEYVSSDVPEDICAVAEARAVNLVIIGFHNPVFSRTMLGGTVHRVLSDCAADVGVFVDRSLTQPRRILVPYLGGMHDRLAMELAGRMARNAGAKVTILHVVAPVRGRVLNVRGEVQRVFEDPASPAPVNFKVVEDESPVAAALREAAQGYDLAIVGVAEEWGLESHLFGWRPERIARECPCSLLLVRKGEHAGTTDAHR